MLPGIKGDQLPASFTSVLSRQSFIHEYTAFCLSKNSLLAAAFSFSADCKNSLVKSIIVSYASAGISSFFTHKTWDFFIQQTKRSKMTVLHIFHSRQKAIGMPDTIKPAKVGIRVSGL